MVTKAVISIESLSISTCQYPRPRQELRVGSVGELIDDVFGPRKRLAFIDRDFIKRPVIDAKALGSIFLGHERDGKSPWRNRIADQSP